MKLQNKIINLKSKKDLKINLAIIIFKNDKEILLSKD